jgi:hypothetical protein
MTMRRKIAALAIAAWVVLVTAAPALAQYVGPTPPEVLPSDTQKAVPSVQVRGEKRTRGLGVTGADVAGIAAIGGVAVAGGMAIRRASRRRTI